MNRAGTYINNLSGEAAYQSFKPNPLPPMPEIELDEEIVALLVDANRQLVKLDTASQIIANADLFIAGKNFATQFDKFSLTQPQIFLDRMVNKVEIKEKLEPVLKEMGEL